MKNNQKLISILFLAILVLWGCKSPVGFGSRSAKASPGTIVINFSAIGRSIVADWKTQITSYRIILTSHNGYSTLAQTATNIGPVSFTGVHDGIWDVSVTAYNKTTVVAVGTSTSLKLTGTEGLSVSITLSPTQTGTGNYSFTFSIPSSTSIDFVSGQLFNADGTVVGSLLVPPLASSGSNLVGTITQTAVTSGLYRLALTFKRGGSSGILAGAYSEAVNIWDNVTSDQWLGNDGELYSQRTFAESDFNSTNTRLENLLINNGLPLSPFFSSLVTSYEVDSASSITITPIQSIAGQTIQYRQDSGTWINLASGCSSSSLAVGLKTNIEIRVTANDMVSSGTYTIAVSHAVITYSSNGATSGSAPCDATSFATGDTVTVLGNIGTMTKTGYNFAGWNTQDDGLGITYAPGATFIKGNSDVTLYAIWLDNRLTYTISGSILTVTGLTGASYSLNGAVVIVGGVTAISNNAFANCSRLTSISIPDSVTSIGNGAFQGCSSLTSVTIPHSVTSINSNLFSDCTNLASVTIPSSVTSIDSNAFSYCTSLASVTIPSSATVIDATAFSFCCSLTAINMSAANTIYQSINGVIYNAAGTTILIVPNGFSGSFIIPSSVTNINTSAFADCNKMTSVIIPSSVNSIGYMAFNDCGDLTSVTIANGVKTIDWYAFAECASLTSISIPSSVNSIGCYAFSICPSLTAINVDPSNTVYQSINGVLFNKDGTTILIVPSGFSGSFVISSSVTNIGSTAFAYIKNLTSVTIPNSVTSIGFTAFFCCLGLTNITIPNSVTSIGQQAFYNCRALTNVICSPSTPPNLTANSSPSEGIFGYCSATLQIQVPSTSVSAYQQATGWSDYSSIIVSQ
jgi:uncharacterized repeat protein (TIGR02543 family)